MLPLLVSVFWIINTGCWPSYSFHPSQEFEHRCMWAGRDLQPVVVRCTWRAWSVFDKSPWSRRCDGCFNICPWSQTAILLLLLGWHFMGLCRLLPLLSLSFKTVSWVLSNILEESTLFIKTSLYLPLSVPAARPHPSAPPSSLTVSCPLSI